MKRSKIQMVTDFLEGLNHASDASTQLLHHYGNMKWMAVRDMLEIVKDDCMKSVVKMGAGS